MGGITNLSGKIIKTAKITGKELSEKASSIIKDSTLKADTFVSKNVKDTAKKQQNMLKNKKYMMIYSEL